MDRINAFVFTLEEYDRFLYKISNGTIGIGHKNGKWFYTVAEDIDNSDETIRVMVEKALNVDVTDTIVDISNRKVVIVYYRRYK